MEPDKVFIVILNWNGKEDTLACLESVRRIDYANYEVVVVDNASSDGSAEAIRSLFPEVTVIETGNNLGYAGGNNVGLRYAIKNGSSYILILNNDTVVDPKIIVELVKASKDKSDIGIFSAKIYYHARPKLIWYAGVKWQDNRYRFKHIGQKEIDDGRLFNSIKEVDYACGCAFFIRSNLLAKIGLFDENYFLTYEEADLCYRARRYGIRSYFVPKAKLWHKVSVSFGGENSPLFTYFMVRNRLLWAEKYLSLPKRLSLYWQTIKDIFRIILPPLSMLTFTRPNRSLAVKKYASKKDHEEIRHAKKTNRHNKAKLYGLRDYLLRRFRDCSVGVKSSLI